MEKLSFTQKQMLIAYRLFYGEEYPCSTEVSEKELEDAHAKMQSMCYLLMKCGITIGDFGYTLV